MKDTATLTIRNVPMRIVRGLKAIAKRSGRSMEQEVRELLDERVAERSSVLRQIAESWQQQSRKPRASEIESWIATGRK